MQSVNERIAKLEQATRTKSFGDNKVISRIREELDQANNIKKEDRVMMIGLNSTTPKPRTEAERKIWARTMVVDILKIMDKKPRQGSAIVLVKVGNSSGDSTPAVEVKFDSRETAFHIRSTFVEAKKSGLIDLGTLHISNVVTLATRVRADILRAVSDQFSTSGKVKMYVSAFNSRPVLHVTDLPNGSPHAMTFSDVMDRYGRDIKPEFLENAYKRVGRSFTGQLAQNFVVLKDNRDGFGVGSVVGRGGLGVPVAVGAVDHSRGRGRGGTPSRLPRGPRVGGAAKFYADVTCHFCKEVGHYKGQCPKNLRGGNGTPRGTPRGAPRGNMTRKRARSEEIEVVDAPRGGRGGSGRGGTLRGPAKEGRVEWADVV